VNEVPDGNVAEKTGPPHAKAGGGPVGTVRLAASAASACLVLSLATGLGVHYFPRLGDAPTPIAAAPTTPSTTWTHEEPTTSASSARGGPGSREYRTDPTAPVPAGYRRVAGAGVSTVVPAYFRLEIPKSAVAADPGDEDFQARFGGDAHGPGSLWAAVSDGAAQVAATTTDYRQVALEEASYDGFDAVEWEYRHTTRSGAAARARALYWRERGAEYVLYVTSPEQRWDEAARLFDALVTHCRIGA